MKYHANCDEFGNIELHMPQWSDGEYKQVTVVIGATEALRLADEIHTARREWGNRRANDKRGSKADK